ncbi:MAG: DUF167 domain-containing protein [Verrucomicrobiales bacterium]
MVSSPFIKESPDGVYLSIKLQPRSSRTKVGSVAGGELKIFVTAPPVDSAANEALIKFVAGILGCSKSSVQLTKGQTSRNKTLFVHGMKGDRAEKLFATLIE